MVDQRLIERAVSAKIKWPQAQRCRVERSVAVPAASRALLSSTASPLQLIDSTFVCVRNHLQTVYAQRTPQHTVSADYGVRCRLTPGDACKRALRLLPTATAARYQLAALGAKPSGPT